MAKLRLLELDNKKLTPVATFAQFNLPPFLNEGLRRIGFVHPTEIQSQAIPSLLAGNDLLAQSQTGSGKTAAFTIPVLAKVNPKSRDLQALIMTPTRELALQVTQVMKDLAGATVRVLPVYGGTGMDAQIRGLQRGGFQVVVGTPGRLRDHLNRGTLLLHKLRMLVLDEADEMLDKGFARDVEALIQAIPASAKHQTALFSATLPDWVEQTAKKQLNPQHDAIKQDVAEAKRPDIEHVVYDMTSADKPLALRHLLNTEVDQSVLVFARTKFGVQRLTERLQDEGYTAAGLQGNLSQREREKVVSAFRTNKVSILVATNVGARGLDVKDVGYVINYDLPESTELFTHRVGRTGRNGASGTAITFLTGEDKFKWREIERALVQEGIEVARKRWAGPRANAGVKPPTAQPYHKTYSKKGR